MEVQVDRLVGPTHHFGGLGVGNLASQSHRGAISNPRAAARQGLDKAALVARLGVPQFILPPQPRPDYQLLRGLGFVGTDAQILQQALHEAPAVLSASMSCSAMWTANAATTSASRDAPDGQLTVTIANLNASLHRSIEPVVTASELQRLLPPTTRFHWALPGGTAARDEGAANHMRLAGDASQPGLHLYVYGDGDPEPRRFFARQSREASQAIARLHGIPSENAFFLKQHPETIDAGAFHNDVVATSHGDVLLHHELAFYRADEVFDRISARFESLWGRPLRRLMVTCDELPLEQAVACYLFNSQIVTPHRPVTSSKPGEPPNEDDAEFPAVLICPAQVRDCEPARQLVERWRDQLGLFSEVHYVELRQSMSAGGGPACLRLRIPVTSHQLAEFKQSMRWTEKLDAELRQIIEEAYPTALTLRDLAEIDLIRDWQQITKRLRLRLMG